MKWKKFLAGILSAAMVLTTVPLSELGGLQVQAEAIADATNIALASARTTVKAFTGNGYGSVDNINDNVNTGGAIWVSGAHLHDPSASASTPKADYEGKMTYAILDLGENMVGEAENFKLRWNNMAFGTKYKIQTSDVCTVTGNLFPGASESTDTTLEDDGDEGWTTVAEYNMTEEKITARQRATSDSWDSFVVGEGDADAYDQSSNTYTHAILPATVQLKRYVRLKITGMNPAAGYRAAGVREFEIWGRKISESGDIDLNDGLVGYYTFDEINDGKFANKAEGEVKMGDAVIYEDISVSEAQDPTGKLGNSVKASNGYLLTSGIADGFFNPRANAAFSFWMNPSLLDNSETSAVSILHDNLHTSTAAGRAIIIYQCNNKRIGSYLTGSNKWYHGQDTVGNIAPEEWWHVVAVSDYTNKKMIFYINGEKTTSAEGIDMGAESQYANHSGAEIKIGKHRDGSNHFDGYLDNIRFYNRTLTDAEVAEIYAEEKPSWTVTGKIAGNSLVSDTLVMTSGDSSIASGEVVEHATPVTFSLPQKEGYVIKWYREENPAAAAQPLATGETYTVSVQNNVNVYAKYELDFSQLDAKIAEAQQKIAETDLYTEASRNTLQQEIDEIEGEKSSYTQPSQVTEAINRLTAAIGALVERVPVTVVVDPNSKASVTITAGEEGTELVSGSKVDPGTSVTLTAKPYENLQFLGWFSDEAMQEQIEDTTTEPYTFEVREPVTVYAKFELPQYTVAVSPNEEGQGSVTVTKGTEVTEETSFPNGTVLKITANSQDGYRFTEWKNEAGELITRDKEFTITVGEDLSCVAYFKEAAASSKNVARGKTVALLDGAVETDNTHKEQLVDGITNVYMGYNIEPESFENSSAIQVDLGKIYDNIDIVKMYRLVPRIYNGTVIVVSDEASFDKQNAEEYTVVYNSDRAYELPAGESVTAQAGGRDLENIHGFGVGTEMPYKETAEGHEFAVPAGVSGRYITIYMRGNGTNNTGNHINELEVYVQPADTAELTAKAAEANEKLQSNLYKEESKEALQEAADGAQQLLDTVSEDESNPVYLTEQEVADALAAIEAGEAALEAEKADLQTLIAEYQDAAARYTWNSWEEFKSVLEDAQAVNGRSNATPQEVSEAVENLRSAAENLRSYVELNALNTKLNAGEEIRSRKKGLIFDGHNPEETPGDYLQVMVSPEGIDSKDLEITWGVKEGSTGLTVAAIPEYPNKATLNVEAGAKGTVQATVVTRNGEGTESRVVAESSVVVGYDIQVEYVTGSNLTMGSAEILLLAGELEGDPDEEDEEYPFLYGDLCLPPLDSVTLSPRLEEGYVFGGWYKDKEGTEPCDDIREDGLYIYRVQDSDPAAKNGVITFYMKFEVDKTELTALLETYGESAASKYTYNSWQEFLAGEALANAKDVEAKTDATPQEVSEAVEALKSAAGELRSYHAANAATVLSIGTTYESREWGDIFNGEDPDNPEPETYIQVNVNKGQQENEIDPRDMEITWSIEEGDDTGLTVQQIRTEKGAYPSKASLSVKRGAKGTVKATVVTKNGLGEEESYEAKCLVTVGYDVETAYVDGSDAQMGSATMIKRDGQKQELNAGDLLFPGESAELSVNIEEGYVFRGWYKDKEGIEPYEEGSVDTFTYLVQESDPNAVDGLITIYAKFEKKESKLNYEELDKQIKIAENLKEEDYTGGWETFWQAFEAAKALKEAGTAAGQEEINAKADALEAAIKGLVIKVETSEMPTKYKVIVKIEKENAAATEKQVTEDVYNTRVELNESEYRDDAGVGSDAKFVGWKEGERIISTQADYVFYIADDITLTPVYATSEEPQEAKAAALMSNVIVAQGDSDKVNVKFVGQLVLPEGCKLKQAGLIWGLNKNADDLEVNEEKRTVKNASVTAVKTVNKSYQYSVTLNGLAKGKFLSAKVYMYYQDADGTYKWAFSDVTKIINSDGSANSVSLVNLGK